MTTTQPTEKPEEIRTLDRVYRLRFCSFCDKNKSAYREYVFVDGSENIINSTRWLCIDCNRQTTEPRGEFNFFMPGGVDNILAAIELIDGEPVDVTSDSQQSWQIGLAEVFARKHNGYSTPGNPVFILYTVGGFHRYYFYRTGDIKFSRSHAISHAALRAVEELGFPVW